MGRTNRSLIKRATPGFVLQVSGSEVRLSTAEDNLNLTANAAEIVIRNGPHDIQAPDREIQPPPLPDHLFSAHSSIHHTATAIVVTRRGLSSFAALRPVF